MNRFNELVNLLQERNRSKLDDFDDTFQTSNQRIRDEYITTLLGAYLKAYQEKIEQNKTLRRKVLWWSAAVAFVVLGLCGLVTALYFMTPSNAGFDLVALISAYATFAFVLERVVLHVTRYAFPVDDEQYITEIVKAIQDNDLEHKRLNINAHNVPQKSKKPK